jgi:hypothetical protein
LRAICSPAGFLAGHVRGGLQDCLTVMEDCGGGNHPRISAPGRKPI